MRMGERMGGPRSGAVDAAQPSGSAGHIAVSDASEWQ